MDPLVGIRLRHLEHRPVGDLECGHLEIAQNEQQAIFRRRQRAGAVLAVAATSAWLALDRPLAHMLHKRVVKGWN